MHSLKAQRNHSKHVTTFIQEPFGLSDLLGDKEVAFGVLEELVKLEDVRVVHLLQDADLREQLLLFSLFQVLFVDDFDRSECIRFLRQAFSHFTVST